MAFNVKTRYALALAHDVLSKPMGKRHGITGFWIASLSRVRDQRLICVAYMPDRRFVLEAEIDVISTHVMVPKRIHEYIEHELLKRSQTNETLKLVVIRSELEQCIKQGRIVVAFRNARAIHVDTGYTGQNPVWYMGAD